MPISKDEDIETLNERVFETIGKSKTQLWLDYEMAIQQLFLTGMIERDCFNDLKKVLDKS